MYDQIQPQEGDEDALGEKVLSCKRFNLTSNYKAVGLLSCRQWIRVRALQSCVFQSCYAYTADPQDRDYAVLFAKVFR